MAFYSQMLTYTAKGRPVHADSRSNDRWFQHAAIVTGDMESAYSHLRQHEVTHISPGPQRLPDWNPNAGDTQAFYFRDPHGHALEILSFPPGKGTAKWQERADRLFIGIDHSAITVQDTDASLRRFYRDQLGLRVAGESENYGPEQERLNLAFGGTSSHYGLARRRRAGRGSAGIHYARTCVPIRRMYSRATLSTGLRALLAPAPRSCKTRMATPLKFFH